VQTEYAGRFRALIDPAHAGFSSWQAVIDAYPRDISPPTDNRPFFFFNTRPGVIFDSNTDQHPARRLAVPMLYAIFIIFFVFSIVSIFLPLLLNKKTDIRDVPHRKRLIVYFAMLGMGFMLIEISLIQRLTVFLGHPTYSFVAVLFSLLLSCGIGSYLSGIWSPQANPKKLRLVLAAIVVLGGFQLFVVYDQFIELMALPRMTRVLLSVASVATIGILMGMCFPMGIQIARGYHNRLIPWAWGVNGAFSVFASSLSIVLALNFGLKAVFGIGLMCYMVAWMIVQRVGSNDVEDVTAETVTTESEVMAETCAL
jgi:hypothetical protein